MDILVHNSYDEDGYHDALIYDDYDHQDDHMEYEEFGQEYYQQDNDGFQQYGDYTLGGAYGNQHNFQDPYAPQVTYNWTGGKYPKYRNHQTPLYNIPGHMYPMQYTAQIKPEKLSLTQ